MPAAEIDVKDIKLKLSKARAEKEQFKTRFDEAFKYTMPWRIIPSNTGTTTPQDTSSDLYTSFGTIMSTDFASMIANTFFPRHDRWCLQKPAGAVPEDVQSAFTEYLKKNTEAVYDALGDSTFYDEAETAAQDLSVSAAGLLIEDRGGYRPIHCQAIPINELLITRDAENCLGFRAWEQKNLTFADCLALVKGDKNKLPAKVRGKEKETTAKFTKVQGCWRDYSTPAEIAWVSFLMIEDEIVESSRKTGEGTAPIIIMRWDPDPNFSWGVGSAMKATPDMRELDELSYLKLKGVARRIDPSFAYDDDGVMNFDGGIPNGTAVPRMKGSQIDIIESSHDIDSAFFALQDTEHTVRRHFYLDEPEQVGKTPPTLGQWADEAMRRQRRLGKPAAKLWPEFISEAFVRFRYLLAERGVVQVFTDKRGNVIRLMPKNPLQRAADEEKVVASDRFLTSVNAQFQPGSPATLVCDIGESVTKLHELAGAEGTVLKSSDEINQAYKAMEQQQQIAGAADALGRSGLAPALGAQQQ